MDTLRVILNDQLSLDISSLQDVDKSKDQVLLVEDLDYYQHVKHHKQKLILLIAAQRKFAQKLEEQDFKVVYKKLTNTTKSLNIWDELDKLASQKKPKRIVITHPSEYHVLQKLIKFKSKTKIPVEILEDDSFISSIEEFKEFAKDKKNLTMEFFYRKLRQKHNVLMENGVPIGGKYNYDAQNRKPPAKNLKAIKPYQVKLDQIVSEVIQLVQDKFKDHFGSIDFKYATSREQALRVLTKFIQEKLTKFGDYQDAMLEADPWLYHSHISMYLNIGLLNPKECILKAQDAYFDHKAPLNSVEGFIRQILGWREYVRGIYWFKMPSYAKENYFSASKKLPEFFWTGKTKLNCLAQSIKNTHDNAYAHHIQRLMVLGNFALLAGINPKYVNEWYLIVYLDAFEWVELPNVTGMILYADGGYLASKPYAASGSYINKMSDYCKNCSYKVAKKNGPNACPFNYLYWNFLINNKAKLYKNQRLRMPYATLNKMSKDKIQVIQKDSEDFWANLSKDT